MTRMFISSLLLSGGGWRALSRTLILDGDVLRFVRQISRNGKPKQTFFFEIARKTCEMSSEWRWIAIFSQKIAQLITIQDCCLVLRIALYWGAINSNENIRRVIIEWYIAPRALVKPDDAFWPDAKTLQWFTTSEGIKKETVKHLNERKRTKNL